MSGVEWISASESTNLYNTLSRQNSRERQNSKNVKVRRMAVQGEGMKADWIAYQ